MAVGSQYKVNQLAKDLSLKTKELTDVMAAAGLDAKTQKALDNFELDVIWETLTKSHQIVGIEDYIDGVTGIPSLRKKAAETKPEAKQKAEKKTAEKSTFYDPASLFGVLRAQGLCRLHRKSCCCRR